MIDIDAACDDIWDGTNGEALAERAGCPGCCYVMGAAAYAGLMAMADGIRANHDPWFHCKRCGSSSLNNGSKCLNCDEDCASDPGETR